MNDKILFIPPAPEAMPRCKQDILDFCQKMGSIHCCFLCNQLGPSFSIYAATPYELTEPIQALTPAIVEEWRPMAFQKLVKKENFSHCIFFEPEILTQKLIPITVTNNIKTIIYEKRCFFHACPITDRKASLFRGASYALADTLITPDDITAASWLCAGFPNSVKVPDGPPGWEKLLQEPRAVPPIVSSYHGLRVFEEVFSALENQLPLLLDARVRVIDSRKPWQAKLELVVDKILPYGSRRRKIVKFGCKAGWRTLKLFWSYWQIAMNCVKPKMHSAKCTPPPR